MKYMRKLVLLASVLCLLPCILLALVGYLLIILKFSAPKTTEALSSSVQFQALPITNASSVYLPTNSEARVEVLTEFFKRYNSPLLSFAQKIVESADKYAIDWRLIPAIAMQESTLCQNIPKNSYNCWGFGIYGGKVTRFSNYGEAIDTITKTLARDYKEKRGLEHPEEIVTRYTPGSGTWADGVNFVMQRIQSNL